MNQRSLIAIIILAGIGSIGSVLAYSGTISAGQGNFNNVLVTGTCSGCGAGEGSFNTYSLVTNSSITSTHAQPTSLVFLNNTGTLIGCDTWTESYSSTVGGSFNVDDSYCASGGSNTFWMSQSMTGEYRVILKQIAGGTDSIKVYKNNANIQTISFSESNICNSSQYGLGISPNGKYIGLACSDGTSSTQWVRIWQGS